MEFVSFEISKKLKEKGFREKCFATYTKNGDFDYNDLWNDEPISYNESCEDVGIEAWIDAPTISQVLKWLREEKGIHICISLGSYSDWDCEISKIDGNVYCNSYCGCHDYEQAALVGISFVIDELI